MQVVYESIENKQTSTIDELQNIIINDRKVVILQSPKNFDYEDVIRPIKKIIFERNKEMLVSERLFSSGSLVSDLNEELNLNKEILDIQHTAAILLLKNSEEFYSIYDNRDFLDFVQESRSNNMSFYIVVPSTFNILEDRITGYLKDSLSLETQTGETFRSLIAQTDIIKMYKSEGKKDQHLSDLDLTRHMEVPEEKKSFVGIQYFKDLAKNLF